MNERADLSQPSFSIAAVERDTGLPKDTLRVWEKRYNFPQPGLDSFGERIYSIDQVEKLRVIKRLLDGMRGQAPVPLNRLQPWVVGWSAVKHAPQRCPTLATHCFFSE